MDCLYWFPEVTPFVWTQEEAVCMEEIEQFLRIWRIKYEH